MTNLENLECIIEEGHDLLRFATASGNQQRAFDMLASRNDLHAAFVMLHELGTAIRSELNS
jgi:hypothetical protein